jgi:hypothetical protein
VLTRQQFLESKQIAACGYRDTGFNLDPHVVAVAYEKFLHLLDCIGWVPQVSSPNGSLKAHFDPEAQPDSDT